MTYKEIVSMARQAGCEESWGGDCFRFSEIELERFAALVAEAEREGCIQTARAAMIEAEWPLTERVIKAIRSRSK